MLTIPGPVILDLNTQRDLLSCDGAYPLFQCDKLHDSLRRLFTFAHRVHMPVVSTRLHNLIAPGQRGNNRLICHPNTSGYQKMPFTMLRKRTEWQLDCGTDLPIDGFRTKQQFIFDLKTLNLFECPRLDRLLSESTAELFIIVGAPLEWTVRTAVLGLLARRHKVAVVSDCLGMWDPYEGDMALRQVESKNIEWLTVEQLTTRFGAVPKSRTTRAARAKSRSLSGATANRAASPKSPRGAFRI